MTSIATLEAEFYRTVNRLIEPTVRSGCAFPSMALTGLIVLETRGRRTGLPHRTPVLATLIGDQVLVGPCEPIRLGEEHPQQPRRPLLAPWPGFSSEGARIHTE